MQMMLRKKIIFLLNFKIKDGGHLQNTNSEGLLRILNSFLSGNFTIYQISQFFTSSDFPNILQTKAELYVLKYNIVIEIIFLTFLYILITF